jgi:hypothetical protein
MGTIELKEFLFIGKIDPTNDYHLGEPIICKPDYNDPELINDIKNCNYINKTELPNELTKENYSLLLIKYGGPDLKALCNNHLILYFSLQIILSDNVISNYYKKIIDHDMNIIQMI